MRRSGLIGSVLALGLAVAGLGQAWAAAKEAPPKSKPGCAFVSEAKGKVVLTRGGKNYLLEGMECLMPGDEVKLAPDAGAAFALCAAAKKYAVGGEAQLQVKADTLRFKSGAAKESAIDPNLCPIFLSTACDAPKAMKEVAADGSAANASRSAAKPDEDKGAFSIREVPDENKGAVTFRNPNSKRGECLARFKEQGRVIHAQPRPVFIWGPADARGAYQLEITDLLDDSTPLLKTTTDAPSFTYPETGDALQADRCYTLSETSAAGDKKQISFLVEATSPALSPNLQAALDDPKTSAPAKKVIAGLNYAQHDFLFDAIKAFSDALALDPGNELIKSELEGLLRRWD